MVLRELNRLVEARVEFAFESTLSGLHYAKRLEDWKGQGYLIEIVYIRLASPQLALSRIASRVFTRVVVRDVGAVTDPTATSCREAAAKSCTESLRSSQCWKCSNNRWTSRPLPTSTGFRRMRQIAW